MTTSQFGYLIHSRPYLESSILADLFTSNQGRLTVVAKGIKKNKSSRGLMLPFQRLQISVSGRGELLTLRYLEGAGPKLALTELPLFCGYYVNELILRLLAPGEVCDELFGCYESVINELARLNTGQRRQLEICLREFEFCLLGELGKALDFLVESSGGSQIAPEQTYWIGLNQGISTAPVEDSVKVKGYILIGIAQKTWNPDVMAGAKTINRFFIDRLLNTKVLHSRRMIRDYIQVVREQNRGDE